MVTFEEHVKEKKTSYGNVTIAGPHSARFCVLFLPKCIENAGEYFWKGFVMMCENNNNVATCVASRLVALLNHLLFLYDKRFLCVTSHSSLSNQINS